MREFASDFKAVPALSPALRTASATGGAVDRHGHESLSFLFSTGAWTDGVHTVVAEHSDDSTVWEPIPADLLTGELPVVDGAGDGGAARFVGYMGDARYVRVKANVSGSPVTGAIVGALIVLGDGRSRPAVQ